MYIMQHIIATQCSYADPIMPIIGMEEARTETIKTGSIVFTHSCISINVACTRSGFGRASFSIDFYCTYVQTEEACSDES